MLYSSIFLSTVLKTRPEHILDSCCVKHATVLNIYKKLCHIRGFVLLYMEKAFSIFYSKWIFFCILSQIENTLKINITPA